MATHPTQVHPKTSGLFALHVAALVALVVVFVVYCTALAQLAKLGEHHRAQVAADRWGGGVRDETCRLADGFVRFDFRTRTPVLALERLTRDSVTPAAGVVRGNRFFAPSGPVEFATSLADYLGSGYDRGHCAPSANYLRSQAENDATFSLANMMPQDPGLNRGPWADLEAWCREQANRDDVAVVYVATLPLWIPPAANPRHATGPQRDPPAAKTIGAGHVHVPTHCAKSVLLELRGDKGPRFEMRGFLVANAPPQPGTRFDAWEASTDAIEHWSGVDLWHALPAEAESVLEAAAHGRYPAQD